MGSLSQTELEGYDAIQLSLTCLSGVNRNLLLPAKRVQQILAGIESLEFPGDDVPRDSYIFDAKSSVGAARIDPETIRHLPWLTSDRHRVGGALCYLTPPSGQPECLMSPRSVALKQVARLKEVFGLSIKSAIEAEFMVFQEDGTTPFNKVIHEAYGRFDNMAGMEESLLDTCHLLEEAGLPLESFMSEFAAGQFEITFRPQLGVASADTIVILKEGLRIGLSKHSLIPTFMACPSEFGHANGFHFNHSLCSEDGVNKFLDTTDSAHVSVTARHWIAGLVHHAPALTALFCPTLNCYRRLTDELTPKKVTWAEENRCTFLRLKTERSNIYLENRLPSSASNPYLVLAGTLAAGIHGLERKLTCPPQNDPNAPEIPKTMEAALASLEQDQVLTKALGEDFVATFLRLAKKTLNGTTVNKLDDLECQRHVYFHQI